MACPAVVSKLGALHVRVPVRTHRALLPAYPSDIVARFTWRDVSLGSTPGVTPVSDTLDE